MSRSPSDKNAKNISVLTSDGPMVQSSGRPEIEVRRGCF